MDLNRIKGKAQDLLKQHGDKIEKGVGKAERFAKSKTSKHDQIDKVAGRLRGLIPAERGTAGGVSPSPVTSTPVTSTPVTSTPPSSPYAGGNSQPASSTPASSTPASDVAPPQGGGPFRDDSASGDAVTPPTGS